MVKENKELLMWQTKLNEEHILEGVSPELVEKFGEENIANLIKHIETDGAECLTNARKDPNYRFGIFGAIHYDAIHTVLKGINLFTEQEDQDFLSSQQRKFFSVYEKIDSTTIRVAYQMIRTGKFQKEDEIKEGEIKEANEYIVNKFKLESIASMPTNQKDLIEAAKLAGFHRIFTGEPAETLLNPLEKNKKTRNKFTMGKILDNLEDNIRSSIKIGDNVSALDGLLTYRLLTAKEVSIIPGKGLVFLKAQGEVKPPQRL